MRDKIMTFGFVGVLFLVFISGLITPDLKVSDIERRPLNTLELTIEILFDGTLSEEIEAYALDHIIKRDSFRHLKSWVEFNVFNKSDVNDYYSEQDHIFKKLSSYKKESVLHMVDYINQVYDRYLDELNVYYGIIPDKEYFLDQSTLDYDDLFETLKLGLNRLTNIPLEEVLKLEDFYLTDPHWDQSELKDVIKLIEQYMSFETYAFEDYEKHRLAEFIGAYGRQFSLTTQSEMLSYLTHNSFEDLLIKNYEDNKMMPVYDDELFDSIDPYELFLSGASPLIEINNPSQTNGKELVLFRDSFGSSITPLLIGGYSKITMVDTRYMPYEMIGDYIDFQDQDVLFLYSSMVVNNSIMLK